MLECLQLKNFGLVKDAVIDFGMGLNVMTGETGAGKSIIIDGLKLAKDYGLPKLVSDFIPMHHGTSRVEYFYRMALEAAKDTNEKVEDSAYRYPGPKPNTKETGI